MFRTQGYNGLRSLTRRPRQRCKFFIPAVKGESVARIHKIKRHAGPEPTGIVFRSGLSARQRDGGVSSSREISVLPFIKEKNTD